MKTENIKEVLFFTYGDSSNPNTWSNVPYCFSQELIQRGIKVHRINISPSPKWDRIWRSFRRRILNRLFPGNDYTFMRSIIGRYQSSRIVKKAVRNYPNSQMCIFTTFSQSANPRKIQSVQLCDWTYEIHINDRLGRKPYFFEQWTINSERKYIKNCTVAVSLFKECCDKIKSRLNLDNVIWCKSNVVNIVGDNQVDSSVITQKIQHKNILFIGNQKYLEGARLLLKAFDELKLSFDGLQLHIIGLNECDFEDLPQGVHCHGYLSKGNPAQCEEYYRLLRGATVFCNPTEVWGGYSSTIESMYYFTPIVVSPYEDFVAEFGRKNNFIIYNPEFKPHTLVESLKNILNLNEADYRICAEASHQRVNDYTWKNFVDMIFYEFLKRQKNNSAFPCE